VNSAEFITLTEENIGREHLCCIIRSKKPHPGVEEKRAWLRERIGEGHVFRKLDVKGTVFIEYAPLETAWVPVEGEDFLYIYCLWVLGEYRGKGYARALMESCIADAKAQGRSGVCMLGAQKQKNWLSNQDFAAKYGFTAVDETQDGYKLFSLSFDGTQPHFAQSAKSGCIEEKELTVFITPQCPFISVAIEKTRQACAEAGLPLNVVHVTTLAQAKALPCVLNTARSSMTENFKRSICPMRAWSKNS
jgi:Acetyltransferases